MTGVTPPNAKTVLEEAHPKCPQQFHTGWGTIPVARAAASARSSSSIVERGYDPFTRKVQRADEGESAVVDLITIIPREASVAPQ